MGTNMETPTNSQQEAPAYKILLHQTAPLVSDFITINRAADIYIMNFRSTLPEILGALPEGPFNMEINLEALPPHTRIVVSRDALMRLKEQIEAVLATNEAPVS